MSIAEIIFYFSFFILVYIYVGYPCLLSVLSVFKRKEHCKGDLEPSVSIIIAAYNEESVIGRTIENKLHLDYPQDKYEIIVVSDGSNDTTDKIVGSYSPQGIRLIRQYPRAGKTSALNMGVAEARGDIIVFADANSIYGSNAVKKLAGNFKDEEVGYVTGKMIYENPDLSLNGESCSAFMKYENALRALETKVGSIVGVNGGIDAIRKNLYRPMRHDQLPDFVLPLQVVEQGYRVVYEPEAILRENSLNDSLDEYKMRVRVSLRAFWALRDMAGLLAFRPFSLFSIQLWSHKVLRYLSFLFIAGFYLGNLLLLTQGAFYRYVFFLQILAYSAALLSPALQKLGFHKFTILNYFVLVNTAAMHAFFKFLLGRRQVLWTPRKG